MDLQQLAAYLHRDVREVSKLANRGYLPGKKVGGEWRFASTEINYWIETQMHAFTEQELEALERRGAVAYVADEPLVCAMLTESTIAVPLKASTKASVLKEMANLAGQSWQIYDVDGEHEAARRTERAWKRHGPVHDHAARFLAGELLYGSLEEGGRHAPRARATGDALRAMLK